MADLNVLLARRACPDALKWARDQNGATYEALWAQCPHGAWLMWVLEEVAFPFDEMKVFARHALERIRDPSNVQCESYWEALHSGAPTDVFKALARDLRGLDAEHLRAYHWMFLALGNRHRVELTAALRWATYHGQKVHGPGFTTELANYIREQVPWSRVVKLGGKL